MSAAFYRLEGGLFHSSELTRGPWDVRAQHAGPPAALLARAAEREGRALDRPHLARLTVELLRPVPIAPLRVEARTDAAGRSAARLSLALLEGDRELARASALLLRERAIDAVVPAEPLEVFPPDACPQFVFPYFETDVGYHTAVELRLARGVFGETATFTWMRPRHPLVEGEETSGAQLAAICADSGNGVSPMLDWRRHGFVNPDLTMVLHRAPRGPWIGLDARTTIEPGQGVGAAASRLWDRHGPVGHGLQSLLCDPR